MIGYVLEIIPQICADRCS